VWSTNHLIDERNGWLGGTGKLAAMKGLVRSTGVSDGKANFNETQTEIEYSIAK